MPTRALPAGEDICLMPRTILPSPLCKVMMWEVVWYVRCSIKQPNWNNGSCTHIPVPLSQYFLLLAFLHSILHISHCNVHFASQVPGVFLFTLLVAAKLAATSMKPTFITFLLFFLVSISSHLCFFDIFIAWHCSLHALQLTSRHANSLSSQISQLIWTFWNQSHHKLQTFVVYSSKEFDSGGLYLQKMTSFPGQSMMKKREFSSHKCRGVKYGLI